MQSTQKAEEEEHGGVYQKAGDAISKSNISTIADAVVERLTTKMVHMQGYSYTCAKCGHINTPPTSNNASNNESTAASANLSTLLSNSNTVHTREPTTTTTSTDAGIRIGTHTPSTVTTHTGAGTLESPRMSRPQPLQMSFLMGAGHEIITRDAHTEAHHGGAHIAQSGGIETTSHTTQSHEETPVIPQHPASQKAARTSTTRAVAQLNNKLEQHGKPAIVRDIPDLSKFKNVHRVWQVHAPCHMHVHTMLCFFIHVLSRTCHTHSHVEPTTGYVRSTYTDFKVPIPQSNT